MLCYVECACTGGLAHSWLPKGLEGVRLFAQRQSPASHGDDAFGGGRVTTGFTLDETSLRLAMREAVVAKSGGRKSMAGRVG